MFVSIMRLPRLALPLLSGIFFLALSGHPSPAQAPDPLIPRSAPGKVVEAITPAATVVSTAHYQVQLSLDCGSTQCTGNFPRPGGKRLLNVTRMSCYLSGSSGSAFRLGYIQLQKADNTAVMYQWLPVDHSTSTGFHTLNQAVDMQVRGSQHMKVSMNLVTGTAVGGLCTATGTLDTLE